MPDTGLDQNWKYGMAKHTGIPPLGGQVVVSKDGKKRGSTKSRGNANHLGCQQLESGTGPGQVVKAG